MSYILDMSVYNPEITLQMVLRILSSYRRRTFLKSFFLLLGLQLFFILSFSF